MRWYILNFSVHLQLITVNFFTIFVKKIIRMQKVLICDNFETQLLKEIEGVDEKQIFVLTDSVTREKCLPLLQVSKLCNAHIITIPNGDDSKNLESLATIWTYLSTHGGTRHSLMINLGGGMITDIGGFAASTFKRGIQYINIPTTLLSIIDAAVGGKTGINFNGLKNEIGVINPAKTVLIDVQFLKTLDKENILSGYAEIVKHGLISNADHLKEVVNFDFENIDWRKLRDIVETSVAVKERIVEIDPKEKGIRKALNLGHTVGHAFESYSYTTKRPILHGHAVALGLVCELYLSHKKMNFPKEILLNILKFIKENYSGFVITCKDYDALYELMTHDKKNTSNQVNFTLLRGVGEIEINQIIDKKEILESLDFYCEYMGF